MPHLAQDLGAGGGLILGRPDVKVTARYPSLFDACGIIHSSTVSSKALEYGDDTDEKKESALWCCFWGYVAMFKIWTGKWKEGLCYRWDEGAEVAV